MNMNEYLELERAKFELLSQVPQYQNHNPGLQWLSYFPALAEEAKQPLEQGDIILDVGCGSGLASLAMHKAGYQVKLLDSVARINPDALLYWGTPETSIEMTVGSVSDLTTLWGVGEYDYFYCVNLLECLDSPLLGDSLLNLAKTARKGGFIHVNIGPDPFKTFINKPVEVVKESFSWWKYQLSSFFDVLSAKEVGNSCMYFVKPKASINDNDFILNQLFPVKEENELQEPAE